MSVTRYNTDGIYAISANNRIGDGTADGRNIVSGNTFYGIYLDGATGSSVKGNYIGCQRDGATALANEYGIGLSYSSNNIIGGGGNGEGNLISGNTSYGLWISSFSGSNEVLGNYIGCNAAGTNPLPNRTVPTDTGIRIDWGSSHNLTGDGSAAGGNLIFGNEGSGCFIDSFGAASDYNLISLNSFMITTAGQSRFRTTQTRGCLPR